MLELHQVLGTTCIPGAPWTAPRSVLSSKLCLPGERAVEKPLKSRNPDQGPTHFHTPEKKGEGVESWRGSSVTAVFSLGAPLMVTEQLAGVQDWVCEASCYELSLKAEWGHLRSSEWGEILISKGIFLGPWNGQLIISFLNSSKQKKKQKKPLAFQEIWLVGKCFMF